MLDLTRLREAILNGEVEEAVALTTQALCEGVDPGVLITTGMMPAMDEAGRRLESEEYFLPELLLSARAMKAAIALARPLLVGGAAARAGCVVIGTVRGDLHDIGKNLVASMLEGAGFEVVDLGVDVAPERFASEARERGADIVALSALLTTTMPGMRAVVQALQAAGVRERVKVMVGGAPLSPRFAEEIGADGYGEGAATAVALARKLAKAS
jgi:corrinoid protein of di/trimethylamine methyltransferase